MGLRDIVLLLAVYGSLPFILRKPFIGILVWNWLGLMNPHRISWVLTNQPFSQLVALALLVSILISRKEQKKLPINPITVTLIIFLLWMLLTTFDAIYPNLAWMQWDKVWKIWLITVLAIMLTNTPSRIIALTTVVALSIGFFGFKGGVFTILTAGRHHVWGPPGSFIGDNNALALALIMTVPLLFFLRSIAAYRVLRLASVVGIVLCVFAILGSHSRGALLGISAMGLYLALKSQQKLQYLLLIAVLVPVGYHFMPDAWHERMTTIGAYEDDASAMGRIKAWQMSINMAMERPLGGGFFAFGPETYLMYLPEVGARRTVAHSIYFQTLGHHGFIGLGLFLLLLGLIFNSCRRTIRRARQFPDLHWMRNLAAMIQVSLIGYAVTGAFLDMAYFDYYYALIAVVVGMDVVLRQREASSALRTDVILPVVSAPTTVKGLPFSPTPKEVVALAKSWYARL